MVIRLFFTVLFLFSFIFNIHASTLTFLHEENTEVELQDAVYPETLGYAPQFRYPTSTVFQLSESSFHFYSVRFKSKEYYLWLEDSSKNIEIDLSRPEVDIPDGVLISHSEWMSGELSSNHPALQKLNDIDLYYANALDSLHSLAQADAQFRAENEYNTLVWDSRSAKRLYNIGVEQFKYEFDENWIHHIPSYTTYWQMMYKLYYQYFHTNSFKGLDKKEIKAKIEADFNYPESRVLVFHHFFREGLTLDDLKENKELLGNNLSLREQKIAEAFIQKEAVSDLTNKHKIDFLFGIDIDNSLKSYFARDSSEKKSLLVFWSVWDNNIATEFNLLSNLKRQFSEDYNFIHICIDAYETPEKTKSFIYQNRVGGFHLLPEQSGAFRKSEYRKTLKIRDFPFYVLAENDGNVIETESIPLAISSRLATKMKHFSTKK